jgi:dihydroorotase
VTDISHVLPALKAMAEAGVLLLVHGEVTDPAVDMFDREAVFIDTKLVSVAGSGVAASSGSAECDAGSCAALCC